MYNNEKMIQLTLNLLNFLNGLAHLQFSELAIIIFGGYQVHSIEPG